MLADGAAAPAGLPAGGAVARQAQWPYSAQPARSERRAVSRERPHSTGVESTTHTSSPAAPVRRPSPPTGQPMVAATASPPGPRSSVPRRASWRRHGARPVAGGRARRSAGPRRTARPRTPRPPPGSQPACSGRGRHRGPPRDGCRGPHVRPSSAGRPASRYRFLPARPRSAQQGLVVVCSRCRTRPASVCRRRHRQVVERYQRPLVTRLRPRLTRTRSPPADRSIRSGGRDTGHLASPSPNSTSLCRPSRALRSAVRASGRRTAA